MSRMRVRSAVVVVVAMVLAPAWQERAVDDAPSGGADLAARMLAPTFAEAGIGHGHWHLVAGHGERKLGARSRHLEPVPLLVAVVALTGLAVLHGVPARSSTGRPRRALTASASRAPPPLRLT